MAEAHDLASDPFVLGGNVFGWTAGEAESFAVLDGYVEAGGRHVDTADSYMASVPGLSGGESEEIVGRWMAQRRNRDEIHLATKVGRLPGHDDLRPATIRAALEASLRRLGTDHVDLYYAHVDDPDTPLADTMETFDALVREGKVRRLAASGYSPARLREALDTSAAGGWARFEVFQEHYNLVHREPFESEVRPLLTERGLVALPFFSLAQGFLTGKYRETGTAASVRSRAAERHLDDRGRRVLAVLDDLAAAHGVSVAAVSLAWLREQPSVAAPVASARTSEQLRDLVATRDLTLGADDLAALDAASG
ncbi:aryl-alcohol dehydrogenase-like predicted oxidoreductase [Nocardioides cavernae]|uniref:Aryl-alcohol dehydrogenase-like predicted oxidoreductase n=1 Tax=Nocardioides cavernae TaxID=1921566 RepID=A0A7Y9KSG8_9ACTN|nr:aldo/keto reductase [Nocardioides cavernae]NYE35818.1 aryl-alcohol dehydrogenase-like predicted oxidoreductase [Nocardioides cavernae]